MNPEPSFWICATCGVEHAEAIDVCAICDDDRQWVPAAGQRWTTLEQLAGEGRRTKLAELEPDLYGITVEPQVGIGQTTHLVRTAAGGLLWDPVGYVDDDVVGRVKELGDVLAITSSHPHMFGAQVEWSRALDGVPVLVSEADAQWIARPDGAIEMWSGRHEIGPGLTLHQFGGHFTGSAVVHWAAGAGGQGVLLASDTIQTNPDRKSVTFMRSYPNRIPLSPTVVQRLANAVGPFAFDRLYDNFGRTIDADAKRVVQRSADRYIGWTRGEFDDLT
jgi:hypothetical protein